MAGQGDIKLAEQQRERHAATVRQWQEEGLGIAMMGPLTAAGILAPEPAGREPYITKEKAGPRVPMAELDREAQEAFNKYVKVEGGPQRLRAQGEAEIEASRGRAAERGQLAAEATMRDVVKEHATWSSPTSLEEAKREGRSWSSPEAGARAWERGTSLGRNPPRVGFEGAPERRGSRGRLLREAAPSFEVQAEKARQGIARYLAPKIGEAATRRLTESGALREDWLKERASAQRGGQTTIPGEVVVPSAPNWRVPTVVGAITGAATALWDELELSQTPDGLLRVMSLRTLGRPLEASDLSDEGKRFLRRKASEREALWDEGVLAPSLYMETGDYFGLKKAISSAAERE